MDTFRGMKRDLGAHAQTPNKVTSLVLGVDRGKCPEVCEKKRIKDVKYNQTIHRIIIRNIACPFKT